MTVSVARLGVLVVVVLGACALTGRSEEKGAGDAGKGVAEGAGLDVTGARAVIEAYCRDEKKYFAPGEWRELEGAKREVWHEMGWQMFQRVEGGTGEETYVIKGGKVTCVIKGMGGWGVMSWCVADLKGDGKKELVVTYSWGSGMHRTEAGVVDGAGKLVAHEAVLMERDCFVKCDEKGRVVVEEGTYDGKKPNEWSEGKGMGVLRWEEGKLRVEKEG